jgi:transcriptional regulator with XRE-family HTH domain
LLFLRNEGDNGRMDDPEAVIAAALEHVGPRLKQLRQRRGITLTGLAASTGISKSTLSRLENGQRRPTLELLLPLAHAYRVPLDDLRFRNGPGRPGTRSS